jgi:Ca2+-binding EF-hand superfamily protein
MIDIDTDIENKLIEEENFEKLIEVDYNELLNRKIQSFKKEYEYEQKNKKNFKELIEKEEKMENKILLNVDYLIMLLFNIFDLDSSGYIDYEELNFVNTLLNNEKNKKEIDYLTKKEFKKYDTDKNNLISYNEFKNYIKDDIILPLIQNESDYEIALQWTMSSLGIYF